MAKGSVAKQVVSDKIQQAFGSDYIGEYDKKLFVWAQENGERVQIAIALTCPKVPVEVTNTPVGDYNFEDDVFNTVTAASASKSTEISDEERARVNDLIKKLGL